MLSLKYHSSIRILQVESETVVARGSILLEMIELMIIEHLFESVVSTSKAYN